MSEKEYTKTSVRQPKALWNKVKSDAINGGKKIDDVLQEILEKHYRVEA